MFHILTLNDLKQTLKSQRLQEFPIGGRFCHICYNFCRDQLC